MAAQGQATMDPSVLDDIINRLTEVRLARPGKQVQLSETEIKQLCVASRDIFIRQPNLLELEAPIKICGKLLRQIRTFEFLFVFAALFLSGFIDFVLTLLHLCLILIYCVTVEP